jgi:hypothetical protein
MVAGFAGCYNWEKDSGTMGRWSEQSPPLAHYVGAPDKLQLMKFDGMWNYDAGALTRLVFNCAAGATVVSYERW